MAESTIIGVIGGTGLYELDGLENIEQIDVDTPFGSPSSSVTRASLEGVELLFIARHGVGHRFLPSEVNYRANIFALKSLGASWCISVSAVGSLREELEPGHVVIPDQFIDRTKGRESTFFGEGVCAHVAFADPFCPVLRDLLWEEACAEAKVRGSQAHRDGVYVCMEGPAFSTRAESHLYRSWGASLIGMTNLTEAKLAREAEIAYGTLAMVTDYDCWRSDSADVDVSEILATLKKNADLAKAVVARTAPKLAAKEPCQMVREALKFAIITPPDLIPAERKRELAPIINKYISD